MSKIIICLALVLILYPTRIFAQEKNTLKINDKDYFAMPGLNIMVFDDIYPEGHQGGISIIQNGVRVATNGDIFLEPVSGQWEPFSKFHHRDIDKNNNEIRVSLSYPDSSKKTGFNPVIIPDIYFTYTVKVKPQGDSVRITVDLDQPLPHQWIGKVGFNLELFPSALFGKSWYLDKHSGIFPPQANGPVQLDNKGEEQPLPLAIGKRLVIAPENNYQRMVIESKKEDIQLLDGRVKFNNSWFTVRSNVPEGATKGAIEWVISANVIPGWKYKPVIHVSQVGYHPSQQKTAVIELDASDSCAGQARLVRISENGIPEVMLSAPVKRWGKFLRYNYGQFDFSSVTREGIYSVEYGDSHTELFRIAGDVYKRNVWQPVLDFFLPVQMCHVRVEEKYRVWHGVCHLDDAVMAPVNHNHFDGYIQGASTLTKYKPMEPVPGLNKGGWHDAGDDDLRIESQADEVYILSLIYENFHVTSDNTSIDEENRLVQINLPDGKPDILQQIEHGLLHITGVYNYLGRLCRGIISPTIHQYTMVGDESNQTDNLVYNPMLKTNERTATQSGKADDRMVFTEENPGREFGVAADLAAATRVLKDYNPDLSRECLRIAEELWKKNQPNMPNKPGKSLHAAIELFITTGKEEYRLFILSNKDYIVSHIPALGWLMGRVLPIINDDGLTAAVRKGVSDYAAIVKAEEQQTPFGVPYKPYIWGAGWDIQKFGVRQYFLHTGFPDIIDKEYILNALNFILGCHPGENTASFASGIGTRSMTTAYYFNRADGSYIPGGVASGTALIRPDFPELKDFPYLWQQGEYVMGGGSSNFMFLVLAADKLLNP